jgi:hypothetical protein
MGSGRGSARRVKAGTVRLVSEIWDQEKWEEYLEGLGIAERTIGAYYGIKPPAGGKLTAEQIEDLFKELFQDTVQSGAFTLPPHTSVEDYHFALHGAPAPQSLDAYDTNKLFLCRDGREEPITDCAWYFSNPRRSFSSLTRSYTVLSKICGAALNLAA